jgi:hypothetical protein
MSEQRNLSFTMGKSLPILKLISIAVVVFLLATTIHEIVGHCGATIALGGKPLSVSTTHFDYDKSTVQRGGQRIIDAAGNGQSHCCGDKLAWLRLATFVLQIASFSGAMMSIFIVGGYLLTPFTGLGDWARFIEGLEPEIFWKIALTAAGGAIIWIGNRLGATELSRLLSHDFLDRQRDARLLTLVPYLGGSTAEALSGIMTFGVSVWIVVRDHLGLWQTTVAGIFPRWPKGHLERLTIYNQA